MNDSYCGNTEQNPGYCSPEEFMPQSVDEILSGAKKTLVEAQSKFPSPSSSKTAPSQSSSYAMVPPIRKEVAALGAELRAKGEMVQKAKEALK
jgi:hypothetical protein